MKLEFEAASQNTFTKHQFPNDHAPADTKEMIRSGIKCAKEGSRAEARLLLTRVTEIEPENETAWMWMASISEYPEELLVFLQKVLTVNPENERALEWAKATRSLLAKTFVERGIHASQEDQKEFAGKCFTQAILHDNQNEPAWLRLAANSESPEEKTAHLQQVLKINPENETALASLRSIKNEMSQSLLKKANFAAMSGERDTARQHLAEVMQAAPELEEAWILKAYLEDDSAEKIVCYEKILSLNPDNEAAQAGLNSLKMLIQKSSETKFSAETILEMLENNQADRPSASFENATDELDADFVKDVESKSNFSSARSVETRKDTDEFGDQDIVFNEMETSEPEKEFQLSEAAGFEQNQNSDEASDVFEIEVSGAEDLPNILTSEETAGQTDSQEENSLFESSNEMILLPMESFDLLPAVEEFSQTVQAFEESSNSGSMQDYGSEAASYEKNDFRETEKFEAKQEQEFEEQPEHNYADNQSRSDETVESAIHKTMSLGEPQACPFCCQINEPQAFICNSCRAMISLSDLEMLLSYREAQSDVMEMAIKNLETERISRSLTESELKNLAIAYFNTKNLRKGLACLQEASQLNPNNVVLSSKVNALKIRLSEIEEQESRAEGAELKLLTIMVVDDSPTVRKLISGKLEKCGHTVVCAAGGEEALSQINDIVPDLILLDIMMPEMDGYQVCKLIRGNESTKDVPVVMISGKDSFFDKVRGRMAGTSGYITKPFGPEMLMRTIETYVL